MSEIIQIFKQDLLKGIHSLLLASRQQEHARGGTPAVSIALLLLLSAVFALIRTMYGTADYGITQHFISTFTILLATYIVAGTLLLVFHLGSLEQINSYAATIFTCLLITGIFYFLSIFWFGFFTGPMLDTIDNALPSSIRDSAFVIDIEEVIPALLFSLLGCWLVLYYNRRAHHRMIAAYSIYSICTTGIFYIAVFDRGHFFDHVMRLIGNITL